MYLAENAFTIIVILLIIIYSNIQTSSPHFQSLSRAVVCTILMTINSTAASTCAYRHELDVCECISAFRDGLN